MHAAPSKEKDAEVDRVDRAAFEEFFGTRAAGRDLPPGEGIGVLRYVIVADTDEEAWALWRAAFVGAAWFAPFGFGAATLRAGEDPRSITPEVMDERGLIWVGSPETVRRQVEQTLDRLPPKYVMAWRYNGLMPRAAIAKRLRPFNDEFVEKL